MNFFKNKIQKLFLIFLLMVLAIGSFLIFQIPFNKINLLKNHYVKHQIKKGRVLYTIVAKKPDEWITFKNINKSILDSIIISEDWEFYSHTGVDLKQIKSSVKNYLVLHKKLRGASTISQQLIKNLFYTNERSYIRKIEEITTLFYLEKTLSKKRILEIYLNIIKYGDKLYGIKNASKYYFKQSPRSLNYKQAAFLAMLLPSPKRYSVSFRKKKLSKYAKVTIHSVLKKLLQAKKISKDKFDRESEYKYYWQSTKFKLEKENQIINTTEEQNSKNNKNNKSVILVPKINNQTKIYHRAYKKRSKKKIARFKKYIKQKNEEKAYIEDVEIDVEDNPHFDDDAIKENIGGIKEEFSL